MPPPPPFDCCSCSTECFALRLLLLLPLLDLGLDVRCEHPDLLQQLLPHRRLLRLQPRPVGAAVAGLVAGGLAAFAEEGAVHLVLTEEQVDPLQRAEL